MIGKTIEQPTGQFALTNGRIVLPNEVVSGKAIVVEGASILGIQDTGALARGVTQLDVGGRYITPGLIDLHTHGALAHTFNEPTPQAFATITEENVRRGVTSLLATVATAPLAEMVECLKFSRAWMNQAHEGSRVLGVHLEGPYINLAQKGALDPKNVRNPDDGSPETLLEHHDVVRIMAYAPELPGALDLTRKLNSLGIVPSAGHSSAKDTDVLAAMKLGLRHVTHVWSAQSTTIREGPWRKPGLLEASLTFDGLTVEMICDHKHLPVTLMQLAYKCIGSDRLCVISDATSGAGLAEGSRFRMGQMEYEVSDGVGMMLDRTAFAGSTTLVNEMISVLTQAVGIPLPEAIRMLTLSPARVIGQAARKGSLAADKDADLAIFDDHFTAWRTMIAGRWAYAA
ncbi:MAG: N-acetylglucosamine-6-phosphate deacetylase [Acidobacteriota bacterium]